MRGGGMNYRRVAWESKKPRPRVEKLKKGPSKSDQRAAVDGLLDAVVEIKRLFECRPCNRQFWAMQAIKPADPMLCEQCGRPV